jgi:hypothetical protein
VEQQTHAEGSGAPQTPDFSPVHAAVGSESAGSPDGGSSDCFTILKGRVAKAMMVEFPALDDASLLLHLFKITGRAVTESQSQVLLQVIRQFPVHHAPIAASILVQRFSNWSSCTPIPCTILSPGDDDDDSAFFDCRDADAFCGQLFRCLEERHGRQLVRAALAFISLARFGVTESELFELLSLCDDVLAEV